MSDFVLPEALMMDIWLNLAIKSTVRFRCVSKPWCASLSDPHFIYKNLSFSDAADHHHDLLLLVNEERPHYSVVSHETLIATPLYVPPEVPVPDRSLDLNVLTPPLDDMVCFFHRWSVGVWNLRTGETAVYEEDDFHLQSVTLGFGFDEKTKDYKIVKISYDDDHFVAHVLSLSSSSRSWRKVGEPNMIYYKDYGVLSGYSRTYRDGTFYWGALDLIVSFDMSTEVFNIISIPLLSGPTSSIQAICKLKEGSMFLIARNRRQLDCENRRTEYEIWALLELGVTQSWTKLLVIDWGCENETPPMGFWRNEVILDSYPNGRPLISDPFKREIKEIQIDEPVDILRCLVWTKGKKTITRVGILQN